MARKTRRLTIREREYIKKLYVEGEYQFVEIARIVERHPSTVRDALISAGVELRPRTWNITKTLYPMEELEKVKRMYVDEEKSMREIAEIMGYSGKSKCGENYVARRLRAAGVVPRTRSEVISKWQREKKEREANGKIQKGQRTATLSK